MWSWVRAPRWAQCFFAGPRVQAGSLLVRWRRHASVFVQPVVPWAVTVAPAPTRTSVVGSLLRYVRERAPTCLSHQRWSCWECKERRRWRGSDGRREKDDHGRTRTYNLRFRRPTPYPLGHAAAMAERAVSIAPRSGHQRAGGCGRPKAPWWLGAVWSSASVV